MTSLYDASALEELVDPDAAMGSSHLVTAHVWGVSLFVGDVKTGIKLRIFAHWNCGLRKPTVLDLVCFGVITADVDWRLREIIEDVIAEQDGLLRIHLCDDASLYVSEIVCERAKIEVLAEVEEFIEPFDYVKGGRLNGDILKTFDENGEEKIVGYVPIRDRPKVNCKFSDMFFE